jgi:hypothetical protein
MCLPSSGSRLQCVRKQGKFAEMTVSALTACSSTSVWSALEQWRTALETQLELPLFLQVLT